jgi:hypothetical protein
MIKYVRLFVPFVMGLAQYLSLLILHPTLIRVRVSHSNLVPEPKFFFLSSLPSTAAGLLWPSASLQPPPPGPSTGGAQLPTAAPGAPTAPSPPFPAPATHLPAPAASLLPPVCAPAGPVRRRLHRTEARHQNSSAVWVLASAPSASSSPSPSSRRPWWRRVSPAARARRPRLRPGHGGAGRGLLAHLSAPSRCDAQVARNRAAHPVPSSSGRAALPRRAQADQRRLLCLSVPSRAQAPCHRAPSVPVSPLRPRLPRRIPAAALCQIPPPDPILAAARALLDDPPH